eukprot:5026222-Pyramimonas_sp.AAC.1
MLRTGWLCRANCGATARSSTADPVPEVLTQAEATPAFWLRGIIPANLTPATPPAEIEQLVIINSNIQTLVPRSLGTGAADAPLLICGDASGSGDSRFPTIRRVGVGLVVISGA